jgi:hypothetical protein
MIKYQDTSFKTWMLKTMRSTDTSFINAIMVKEERCTQDALRKLLMSWQHNIRSLI